MPVRLVFDYNNDSSIINAAAWIKVTGWLFTGGLLALLVFTWRRFPAYSLAAIWFFMFLLPVSSFFPIYDVIFEHRLYAPLALWGFLISAVTAAVFRDNKNTASMFLTVLAVSLGAFYGAVTYMRNKVYKDPGTLWKDVIDKVPNNSRARLNYANWLYHSDLDAAIKQYGEVIKLVPSGAKSEIGWNNLGKTTMEKAERILKSAQTVPEGERAKLIESARDHFQRALGFLDRALKEYELYSVARLNKGMTLLHLAELEFAAGNASSLDFPGFKMYEDALKEFSRSISIEKMPNNVMNFRYLIQSHERLMDGSYKLAFLYQQRGFQNKAKSTLRRCFEASGELLSDARQFIPPSHPLINKADAIRKRTAGLLGVSPKSP
ncbi:MAG: tetratricopeptide repeat protein [Planctomycetota bacterium]